MVDRIHTGAFPAEQRAHERLPLQKNVLLIARGMNQRSCRIQDICAGGALVELRNGEESRELRRGEVVLLRLSLGEGREARAHELRARIAHAERQLFGVSFFNPDPTVVASLLEAARSGPPGTPVLPESSREVIESLGQQLLSFCGSAFGAFFQRADEYLLAAAEHAHGGSEKVFFEAATQLRKQRDDIRSLYLKELKQSWTAVMAGESGGTTQGDRPFEEWLAVKVMAARVEEKCRAPLAELRTGLDTLSHGAIGGERNPFAPLVLCGAFQRVLGPLGFPAMIEKGLYRVFEETVLVKLGDLYEVINNNLARHGALPAKATAPMAEAVPATAAAPRPEDVPTAAPPAEARAKAPARTEVPRDVADFAARTGLPLAAAARPTLDFHSLIRLLGLQQELQAGPEAPAAPVTLPADASEARRLFAMLKAANGGWKPALEKFVQHADEPALARAALALQQFVEDLMQALAPAEGLARHWLQPLQLPVLHVLVSDSGFFRNVEHPARQVLEHLALLGQAESSLTADQRGSVEHLVERIARDFDSDAPVFAQALQELGPLAAWLEQSRRRNIERVCRMVEGEQRLAAARQRVQEELDARLAGRKVPQPVVTLLDAGWRDLLTNTLLRQGEQSSLWQQYLGLVDELMAIGADMQRPFNLREILRLLKTGLLDAGELNARQQQQMLGQLKVLLGGAQRMLNDVAWVAVPAKRKEENDNAEERWLQKWLERAQRLRPGEWMQLRQHGEAEHLELAWRDDKGERYVFVNRQGLKGGDFSRRELATLMHGGNALSGVDAMASPLDDALRLAGFQLYERLLRQMTHDSLTGLANRAEFLRQVDRALDSAKRQRTHHVLACISLDGFSDIHNTARAVAEQLLKSVAHLLAKALAPKTTVARLDNDDFALLLEDCELGKAQQLFSMRLGELAAMRLSYEGEIYKLTASAGLVDVTYTSDTAEHVLRTATEACGEAHRHGGNRIQVYQPTREEQARRDAVMVWVARLNQALEEERLALRCQRMAPVRPGTDASLRYEMLLGMREEDGKDWPPSEFVQAAERYNRMLAVDRWVVGSVCQWLRDHPDKRAGIGMVSINLSAHSLRDGQTLSFILDRLLAYQLPPSLFCFEISEVAASTNMADALDLMRELKKIGCRFALDDFGVCHDACEQLRQLPLDFVKIDGAFVRRLADGDDRMVRAIDALAHYSGLKTIAEFVEDEAILKRLDEIGVNYAQGYGIERPRWLDGL